MTTVNVKPVKRIKLDPVNPSSTGSTNQREQGLVKADSGSRTMARCYIERWLIFSAKISHLRLWLQALMVTRSLIRHPRWGWSLNLALVYIWIPVFVRLHSVWSLWEASPRADDIWHFSGPSADELDYAPKRYFVIVVSGPAEVLRGDIKHRIKCEIKTPQLST